MKHTLLVLILISCFSFANAKHVTGGEMIYDYLGIGSAPNLKQYRITLKLFRDQNCMDCSEMPPIVRIGIFNNGSRALVGGYHDIELSGSQFLPMNPLPPCITNAPSLSYTAGFYEFTVELADNNAGYTATYQTCCRIDNIVNVPNSIGSTYTCTIPGTLTRPPGFTDNSPRFSMGISIVCYDRPFTLDFSATDPDADSLVYSLCDGYNGGGAANASLFNAAPPPYGSIDYRSGYSGTFPLGNQAAIDPNTGIISGIAPGEGKYVVSVCINAYRNGVFVAEHRKDFIITVAPCDFGGVKLKPSYISCDGFNFTFQNLNNSPLNLTYYWDFGDGTSSTDESPTHSYVAAGAGDYILKLVINRGGSCSDSATAPLKVYPGYFPGFTENSPICKDKPLQFRDATTATYGVPNSWHWDFGVQGTRADTSRLKEPLYTYTTSGTYTATLIVASDKGCIDTVTKVVTVVDKPTFSVSNDTLICNIDTMQLNTVTTSPGTITWSPNYNINDIHSFAPLVSPDVTTTYQVTFIDNSGCVGTDEVKISVVDHVTLNAGADTGICRTDAITLRPNSDGLKYEWSPAATLNDAFIKNPIATPTATTTTYVVTARIGKCFATDDIKVTTAPYPDAKAGADTMICFGNPAQLHASGGSIYSWSPTAFLSNPNIANPVSINPTASITYVVTVRDVLGCPKAVTDSIMVNVAHIVADAGPSDTSIVMDQPLQLLATGSINYSWTPGTWLNSTNIPDPVSLPEGDIKYTVTVSNNIGCFDTDTIKVKFFKVKPDLFVPTAFSPNGDGTNDILKPLALGLKSVDAFKIYNRWGQLLFSTSEIGRGWDGTFGGATQSPGTYVWFAQGTDYKNAKLERKGTVVLIR